MGYFDSLLAAGHVEELDGRIRFHPYGVFGAGYRMTRDEAARVKRFLTTYYVVTLPVAILGVQAHSWIGWPTTLALAAFFLGLTTMWYVVRMRQLLAGAERVATRMTLGENARNMAEREGLTTTVLMAMLGKVATFASIWALFAAHGWRERTGGFAATLLFGSCLSLFAYKTAYLIRRSTHK